MINKRKFYNRLRKKTKNNQRKIVKRSPMTVLLVLKLIKLRAGLSFLTNLFKIIIKRIIYIMININFRVQATIKLLKLTFKMKKERRS